MIVLGLVGLLGSGCAEDNEAKLKADLKENGGQVEVIKEAPKPSKLTTPGNYPGRPPR